MFESIWKRTLLDRARKLDIEGSPPFPVTIADLAASGSMFYGMEHRTDVSNFNPMNYLRILNKGGTTLQIVVNENTGNPETIPDSTAWEFKGIIRSFTLTNLSTTSTATGTLIYTTVQHKPLGG